jgi:hypothetical protein
MAEWLTTKLSAMAWRWSYSAQLYPLRSFPVAVGDYYRVMVTFARLGAWLPAQPIDATQALDLYRRALPIDQA